MSGQGAVEALAQALVVVGFHSAVSDQAERDAREILDALPDEVVLAEVKGRFGLQEDVQVLPGCVQCRAYVRGHDHRRYVTPWRESDR